MLLNACMELICDYALSFFFQIGMKILPLQCIKAITIAIQLQKTTIKLTSYAPK